MGRLTETIDYLKRPVEKMNDLKELYSHIEITQELKQARSKLKLYKLNK